MSRRRRVGLTYQVSIAMIAATATAMPPVVTAMPLMPGATAAERLAHAQARVDQLDLLIDEKFEGLGEAGITRPKDALLFTRVQSWSSAAADIQVHVLQYSH